MADYKQIAVWNERRFREKCDILTIEKERYKTLLYNAITVLETEFHCDIEYIIEELGLRENEYNEIVYGEWCIMTLTELEKLITFYNECSFLSEETKQELIKNLFQKEGNPYISNKEMN